MSNPISDKFYEKSKWAMSRALGLLDDARDQEYFPEFKQNSPELICWASLSAEMLGKSVLSSINELLVVGREINDEINAVMMNINKDEAYKEFYTIPFQSMLDKLSLIFSSTQLGEQFDKEMSDGFKKIYKLRSAVLHGIAFQELKKPDTSHYWRAMKLLLAKIKKSFREFLGEEYAHFEKTIEDTIHTIDSRAKKRVNELIKRAKIYWEEESDSRGGQEIYREEMDKATSQNRRIDAALQKCPVCNCLGWIFIDEAEGGLLWTDGYANCKYRASRFVCMACRLKIEGASDLKIAKLPIVLRAEIYDLDMPGEEMHVVGNEDYSEYIRSISDEHKTFDDEELPF